VFGKSVFTRHPTVTGDATWNMPVGYGLSETCAFFAAHPSSATRELMKQSIGRLLPGNELRVVEPETGRVLGPNEEGELAIRGPTLMEHYVKRTRAECFDADGFFRTGDVGTYDEDGFVHFSGRRPHRRSAVVHRRDRHEPRVRARPGRTDPELASDVRWRRVVVLRADDRTR
jgi:fatty-acyl-CoA synthase